MSYEHLNATARGRIQALTEEGKSVTYIADTLGRHHSSISRELRRNGRETGYDGLGAQRQYEQRRKACRPARKLEYQPLRDYVFQKIPEGMTPEQLAGRLPLEYPEEPRMRISHEALYQALYADERLHCLIAYLPQARPKRRKRGQGKTRRGPSIPNRTGIEQRPTEVQERSRYGDWEGDTLVGANQQAFVATLAERKSLFTILQKTDSKNASEVAHAITQGLLDMPPSWLKTLTFDNGTEFAYHQTIAQAIPIAIYFADPYAAYQRGTNENTNGLIRRYLPKGTDFRTITQHDLDHIAQQLNNRPRKKLNYRTPNEVFWEQRRLSLGALRI
jgi:transposase, IS30 family